GRAVPQPSVWLAPLPDLQPAGAGSYWLDPGWVVDVVPSGLAVRPAAVPQRPDVVALPVDPDWISVVVAVDPAGPAGPPPGVQARIEGLLGALPPASVPLRVVAPHPVPPALLAGPVGRSGAPLHVLTPNGPAVPSPAAPPPAAPAALSTVDGVG